MIDTHSHLLDSVQNYYFYRPVENPSPILSMSTNNVQWRQNQKLAQLYPEVFFAVGIHPWFVSDFSLEELEILKNYLEDAKCLAIGEIGLDFSIKHKATQAIQTEVFTRQCSIAQIHHRPVSIHAVKCHNDMLQILKSVGVTGVIHGLSASKEICQHYLKLGFKIGVNAMVCQPNAKRIREMVIELPLDSFVLETDFPNLLESLNMDAIVNEISFLTGRSKAEVIAKTTYNAQQIFGFTGQ